MIKLIQIFLISIFVHYNTSSNSPDSNPYSLSQNISSTPENAASTSQFVIRVKGGSDQAKKVALKFNLKLIKQVKFFVAKKFFFLILFYSSSINRFSKIRTIFYSNNMNAYHLVRLKILTMIISTMIMSQVKKIST